MNSPKIIAATVAILAIILLPIYVIGEEKKDRDASLRARIDSLRIEAKYKEAVELAEKLLDLRRLGKKTKTYRIADAERLLKTLELIARLPTASQRELAEGDQLTREYLFLAPDVVY